MKPNGSASNGTAPRTACIEYAVSPRFAVACSGKAHARRRVNWRRNTAPTSRRTSRKTTRRSRRCGISSRGRSDYTDVYDKCGLLAPRTVLGHCIHLSAARARDAGRARRERRALPDGESLPPQRHPAARYDARRRPRIGLGSDVAAGPELNIWQVMRRRDRIAKGALLLRARTCRSPRLPTPAPRHARRGGGPRQRRDHRQLRHRQGSGPHRHRLRRAAPLPQEQQRHRRSHRRRHPQPVHLPRRPGSRARDLRPRPERLRARHSRSCFESGDLQSVAMMTEI